MTPEDIQFHLEAGRQAGQASTCGKKINYQGEASATKAAERMSIKYERPMEAYPCYWCHGWHIGGKFER